MGKITVKHYLNTNLKPYIINGEKYYSIYILVTANRQNTKVKSCCFSEYYTESDFEEILQEENGLLNRESTAITNFVDVLMRLFGGNFDTGLFSAMYSFLSNLFIWDVEAFGEYIKFFSEKENKRNILFLMDKTKNTLGIDISDFMHSDASTKENTTKGMTMISYYSDYGQSLLKDFLIAEKCKIDIDEAITFLNELALYDCLLKFRWVLIGGNKSDLYEKYQNIFDNDIEINKECYAGEYGVPAVNK